MPSSTHRRLLRINDAPDFEPLEPGVRYDDPSIPPRPSPLFDDIPLTST